MLETEFKTPIKGQVDALLEEIGYQGHSVAQGTGETLTADILEKYPSLRLHFIERDKANQFYSVVFALGEIVTMNENQFVMLGSISLSGQEEKPGYVEFSFRRRSFYRINYYSSGSTSRICPLMMDDDHMDTFSAFFSFITYGAER